LHCSGAGLSIDLRKGEPKVVLEDWPPAFKRGECPGPELPHATGTPARLIAGRLHVPGSARHSIQGGRSLSVSPTRLQSRAKSPHRRPRGYAVGAWGNLCKAEMPSKGQTAAHGQITERNYSVPRMRIPHSQAPVIAPPRRVAPRADSSCIRGSRADKLRSWRCFSGAAVAMEPREVCNQANADLQTNHGPLEAPLRAAGSSPGQGSV
jgi:hypothetical protein